MFNRYKLYKDKKVLKKNNYYILLEQLRTLGKEMYNMRKRTTKFIIIEGQTKEVLEENYNKFLVRKYDFVLGIDGLHPPEELDGIGRIYKKEFRVKGDKYCFYVEYETWELKQTEPLRDYNKLKQEYSTKRIVLTKIYDASKDKLYFPDVALNEAVARVSIL